jgi:hypothetical protein
VSDWDAIIGEAALGLDLARVDAARNRPGLALARRSVAVLDKRPGTTPDTGPGTTPDMGPDAGPDTGTAGPGAGPLPGARPTLKLASRLEPTAIDPDAIFREEALEFRARGRDTPGGVVRLGFPWLTWAYRVTLVLLAAAIAGLWVIRTDESTSGPVAVDGRTGMVTALLPAAAGPDLAGSPGLTVVLPGGQSIGVTGLHAVLAGDAAISKAGFTPPNQPAILVTGQLDQAGPVPAAPKSPQAAPLRTQATVVLRSETLADVLARQFDAMLGQEAAP